MFNWSLIEPELADETGLVAIGGDLEPGRLLDAYRRGIFPWYAEGDPILWWSPDPRAIFEFDRFHIPRRLARTLRSGKFLATVNRDFSSVIHGCAESRPEGTWLTAEMIAAYERLHRLGYAHSLEVWHEGLLVGGIYGVALGGFFAGESMFHTLRDASKVALASLVERLQRRGFVLFDTQMRTDHTTRMGARDIPRSDYLTRLSDALRARVKFD
jgi:leucyl/phenylalanyl-tRNA--protein transferase